MDAFTPTPHPETSLLHELGLSPRPTDLIEAVKAGLPIRVFRALAQALEVSDAELARLTNISSTTLTRRKRAGTLSPEESERVLRLARLLHRAADVFETLDSAADWLKEPNRALGDDTPLAYAETELGAREVENLLGRLEYGVYS